MHSNQIYDLDRKLYLSDCPSKSFHSSTAPLSAISNNGAKMLPILNFSKFNPNTDGINMAFSNLPSQRSSTAMDTGNSCELVILEQPTEKFRFRYKSEMHGTHGALNGDRSERTKKTFPEVELRNFNSTGVIRCSLYQTNIDKPSLHSHQLVVHKHDKDVCDPHDVYVSPEKGYIARFENMGIIHTAKKDISKELLKKKREKFKFELQCEELSQKQEKALRDEAEREVKAMNLNQVRLCFEAFKIVDGGRWIKICEPVFSRPINNRKSALTGELKICRLSIIAGTAAGGDDLILLVEKVNKNNIKVRFYETVNDEEVWEAFGYFTEADVHHQYAIVVRTPAYKDKDIDCHVNVFVELVRESDNERSAPVTFRYKPRDIVLSRKRRRTSNISSSTSSPLNSFELPESVAKCIPQQVQLLKHVSQTISQEYNKDAELKALYDTYPEEYHCQFNSFMQQVGSDSDELVNIIGSPLLLDPDFGMLELGLETDGEASPNVGQRRNLEKRHPNTEQHIKPQKYLQTMKLLISAFKDSSKVGLENAIKNILSIFENYAANNDNGDTIVHDIIKQGSQTDAIIVLKFLSKLNLTNLLSQTNNLGQTPLHVACIFDKPIFIRPLLGLKCDPNVQDTHGNTALHIAIAENLKQCTEGFVSHVSSSKLNVNLTNDDGFTPLHLAIRKNNIDFVKILLVKCNASAKIANSCDGNNALHLAVQQNNKEIVKFVLENSNLKVCTTNRAGHTAIDLAKSLAGPIKKEILDILQDYLPSTTMLPPTTHFIKEEPDDDSGSSTDGSSSQPSLEIKEENEEIYLKQLLRDESVCRQLGEMLNVDNKWKKLGSQLRLDHLLFMWDNAEPMLRYVVRMDDIKALYLLHALQAIDKEAASMVTSLLKS